MKSSIKIVLGIFVLSLFFFAGCNKKETVQVDNETQSAVDNAVADQEYMAVAPAVQSHAINTKGTGAQNRTMAMCDTLQLMTGDTAFGTPNHQDPVYYMNISNNACGLTMNDGRFRSGGVKIRLTGKIKNTGSQMIIKFVQYQAALVDYSCDSMVITTIASNTLFTSFNIKLVNGVCQKGTNWTIKYSFDRTITFYQHGNPSGTDPRTSIFGTANGINREGRAFTVVIPEATPMVKYNSCQYIQQGILQLTPNSFATRTIDYGYSIAPNPYNGCDEDASFTVNGNTVAFKLK